VATISTEALGDVRVNMRTTNPLFIVLLTMIFFCDDLIAQNEGTEVQTSIYLRAKKSDLPFDLVKYIGINAVPETIYIDPNKQSSNKKLKELIIQKCGSVQDGYVEALNKLNMQPTISMEQPLRSLGGKVVLPSCLYISSFNQSEITEFKVSRNQDLSSIYDSFTGGGFDVDATREFFPDYKDNINLVDEGANIGIPYMTAASELVFNPNSSTFKQLLARFPNALNMYFEEPNQKYGEVVLSMELITKKDSVNSQQNCNNSAPDYPFKAEEIFSAIQYMGNALRSPKVRSIVAIVDNGFLGVEVDANNNILIKDDTKLSLKNPFPERLFLLDEYFFLGPSTFDSQEINPINYLNRQNIDISQTTGHGTHVSGLIIGGVAFAEYFPQLYEDDYSYIKLMPINLNRGGRYLQAGSETRLNNSLVTIPDENKPSIVNFSIAYTPKNNLRVLNRVKNQLRYVVKNQKFSNTVFVAAAGNESSDLSHDDLEVYPAKFGGSSSENVITVASHDADNSISAFSNYGIDHVDIAAPGCKIKSWLNLTTPHNLSGTSQAAPLVSFAAALLRTSWVTSSARIKNRIVYSGDLFEDKIQRKKVRSRSTLSIFKSLLIKHDYIAIKQHGSIKRYLGKVRPVSQLECLIEGIAKSRSWRNTYAIKKDKIGNTFLFYGDKNTQNIDICEGQLKSVTDEGKINRVAFMPEYIIEGTGINVFPATGMSEITIHADEVVEIIKSEY
jgi:subtilisin family serine protease